MCIICTYYIYIYIYREREMYYDIFIYIYIYVWISSGVLVADVESHRLAWVFITGGCRGRGVQWMEVALYNELVYNII